ncbi:MAG: hypothetical protein NC205_02890 [Prevotella sp.]|nr:hypothetical protein [Alistipes senegalensis]MCM1357513.1 hypothetical protein [Prevotella sp.]MCM1473551.1 hypothetical protein [Muribaculaceae bacterium]
MKLNYRDKVILGVLLAVVIAIAGFVGLIKPKNEEIKEDEATLVIKQEEQADLEARIAKIQPLKNNIDETYEETNKLIADFIPISEIDTAVEVDQYMQHYAEECGVRIDNLEITANRESAIDYYYLESEGLPSQDMRDMADLNGDYAKQDAKDNAESNALSQRNVENIIQAQYGVQVTGTKEAIWSYLKAIEELEKTIIVNQVRIEDYSFGADALEKEGITSRPSVDETPDDEEQPETTDENAEQPVETTPDENAGTESETPEPAQAPAALTIDDANTSSVQLVISLYSVYDMPKPNTEE